MKHNRASITEHYLAWFNWKNKKGQIYE
jgi:hypothetical protein